MASDIKERQSIWAQFEAQIKSEAGSATTAKASRSYRWVVAAIFPLVLVITAGIAVMLPLTLTTESRLSLWTFACAVILWSTTKLNAAFVALAAVLILVLAQGAPQQVLYQALASDIIWLMIGAFVLGEAFYRTGLANRLTSLVAERAKTVNALFWLLTFALIPLTFFIPSTSGRAAVVLPVFNSVTDATNNKSISRALSLLLPTIILVVTISSLTGAGSHLIANDLLQQQTGNDISYFQWILYGLPFGIAAALLSCWVILQLFLSPGLRRKEFSMPRTTKRASFTAEELKTLAVAAAMVLLWTTENLHGIEIATVAVAGALVLTLPAAGVLTWKQGLTSVSWNLVIFVGAALVLGQSLIDSGAAKWIIDHLFSFTGIGTAESTLLLLIILLFITLTSHIYMTSHTARAAALVPGLLYLASSLQLNPMAVLFISIVGMDYCLTFPVSSKALLMFQETDRQTFQPADLLRLSAVMIVIHFLLMILFYFTYWRWVGLELFTG